MMQQPIQDRHGQDLIVEDFTPVGEAFVAGHDETAPFIAADQQSEEQAGLLSRERQIPQLIEMITGSSGLFRRSPFAAYYESDSGYYNLFDTTS